MKPSNTMIVNNKIVIIYMATISVVAMYLLVINFTTPYIGIKVKQDNEDNYKVSSVNEIGWGKLNDIRIEDSISKVDEKDVYLHSTVIKNNRIEHADSITIIRNGNAVTLPVTQSFELVKQNIYYVIFPSLYFILNLLLSLMLFNFKGHQHTSKWLIVLLMTLALCYISASLSAKLHTFAGYALNLTFLLSPVLFLHFIYHYLDSFNKNWFSKKILYVLYFAVVTFFTISFILNESIFLLIVFTLLMTIIGILLIKGYYIFKGTEGNQVFRWMVYSLLFSVSPFILLYALPLLLLGDPFVSGELTSVFIFVIPVIYLYLLCTDKLFKYKFYIKRFGYYIVISLFPSFTIIVLFKGFYGEGIPLNRIVEHFLLIFFTTILFLYFKQFLDRQLKAKLLLDKGQIQQSLNRGSEAFKKEKTVEGVLNSMKRELIDVLGIVSCYYVEVDKNRNVESVNNDDKKRYVPNLKAMPLHIGSISHKKNYIASVVGEVNNKYILIVGIMKTTARLAPEEKEWLETLSYFTSISIENIQKIEDLLKDIEKLNTEGKVETNWLVKLLFRLSEKERSILAADLHDTVLQELLIIKRNVEMLYSSQPNDKMADEIKRIEESIMDAIYLTRETCNELRPPFLLEMGLKESLRELVQKFQLRSNSRLDLEVELKNHRLNEEYELAIYRIIQEMLNNAMKHAKASLVSIQITSDNNEIGLFYKDDGVGMTINSPKMNGSIGIIGIKERVRSLGGSYEVSSELNQGVSYKIRFLQED
jgi:two-component system, NarL family, sensor histidine kinase ComP